MDNIIGSIFYVIRHPIKSFNIMFPAPPKRTWQDELDDTLKRHGAYKKENNNESKK